MRGTIPNTDANRNPDRHSYSHGDGYANCHSQRIRNAYGFANANGNANRDGYRNSDSHGYANRHT
jgi:hypothetical protein